MIMAIICIALNAYAGDDLHWTSIEKNVMINDFTALRKYLLHMKTYQVNVIESSYEDYNTITYSDRSVGYFKRDKYEYRSYLVGIYTIQDNVCRVVIDSTKKVIMVADPTKSLDPAYSISDYQTLLKSCIRVEMAKADGKTTYRMEFSKESAYSAFEMTVKDSMTEKIVLYLNKKVKAGTRITQPRIEIDLENWTEEVKDKKESFTTEPYVFKKGDTYYLKPRYAGKYKLSDQRVQSRTTKK